MIKQTKKNKQKKKQKKQKKKKTKKQKKQKKKQKNKKKQTKNKKKKHAKLPSIQRIKGSASLVYIRVYMYISADEVQNKTNTPGRRSTYESGLS